MNPPATELTESVPRRTALNPGRALDLACGSGRHAIWLRDRGWLVTAVDIAEPRIEGVTCVAADLTGGEFTIRHAAWDLIVCWLYWQENLLPSIAAGVRAGGIAALAGKVTGRFATSCDRYRGAFPDWEIIREGTDMHKAFFIARKPPVPLS